MATSLPILDAAAPCARRTLSHLVLVPNPAHHPRGDFALAQGRSSGRGRTAYTYSGIGIYRPELFAGCDDGRFPLLPLLQRALAQGRLYGEVYTGCWTDVGTPERLAAIDRE